MGAIAGAAVGSQALGGLFSVLQASEQGTILRQNAGIVESNIPYIRAKAAEQARQLQVGKYLTTGVQRASYGARGFAQGGSLFDIMADTARNYDRDTSFVLLEGELNVRGQQRQADLYRYQARTGMRDAIVSSVLNTTSVGSRAMLPGFGSGGYTQNPLAGSGYGTADPRASSTLTNWYGGGGYGSAP